MAWLVLLVSAVFEAIWATALGMSHGLTEPGPTAVFLVANVASMLGLGWAAKHIPIGTAYAVWTGVGAALTVTYAMATGEEPISIAKVVFIAGIIGAVAGLKLVPAQPGRRASADND
ncbi:DMT family transporter [Nigerium massiliense]|uniref:DMT family transporter n=1 Tax=Nigerium massiliense TaxID=1522317 RepID=UPI00058FBDB2|nr:multidrug efflux SMR transporter [Nigerium massiliense]